MADYDKPWHCVNFLAGVPDAVLAGGGIDGPLLALMRAVLRDPADRDARDGLADRLIELSAYRQEAARDYSATPVISTADSDASVTPGRGTPPPTGPT